MLYSASVGSKAYRMVSLRFKPRLLAGVWHARKPGSGEYPAAPYNTIKLTLGYPFNRTGCRLRRWITLVLARTIRGPWASSRPGSAPMRTVLDYLEWL